MEAEATTNPTFEAEPWVQTLDIEAAVRDGELTAEQAVLELQRQMERRVAALESRFGPAGELDSTVRAVVSRLTEAPMVRRHLPHRRERSSSSCTAVTFCMCPSVDLVSHSRTGTKALSTTWLRRIHRTRA